jgi:anthranilate phosphoribosyltransferase
MAVLNAAIVLKLVGLADSLTDGVEMANAAIEDGKAKMALLNLIAESGGDSGVIKQFD